MKIHNSDKSTTPNPAVVSSTGVGRPAIFQLQGLQEMADNSLVVQRAKAVQVRAEHALQLKGTATAPVQRVEIHELKDLILNNCPRGWTMMVYRYLRKKYQDTLHEVNVDTIVNDIAEFTALADRKKPAKRKREEIDPPLPGPDKKEDVKRAKLETSSLAMEIIEEEEGAEEVFTFTDNKEDQELSKKKDFWLGKAQELQVAHKEQLSAIATYKIAIVLLNYKQGLFSGMGQGGNVDYIRSDGNLHLMLRDENLSAKHNTEGKLPDMFKEISPAEFSAIVGVLKTMDEKSSEKKEELPMPDFNKDVFILQQRHISQLIITALGQGGYVYMDQEITDPLPVLACIFDNNYAAINIHFPALYAYISKKKNKENVGDLTYASMSKFIMARLISAYNAEGGDKPFLTEKSSFSFKLPTLDDLGKHLSIRLSAGIYETAVAPLERALRRIEIEVYEMMVSKDKLAVKTDGKEPNGDLSFYWGGKTDTRMNNLQQEKSVLDHLLFTLIEKGSKKISILGRVFERNAQNILALTGINAPLEEIGKELLELHQLGNLENSIKPGGSNGAQMSAPQMLSGDVMNKNIENDTPDNEARRRLALMVKIAAKLSAGSSGKEDWHEDASDSEFEEEDEMGKVSGDKVVIPTGMAALEGLLLPIPDNVKKKPQYKANEKLKGRMAPDKYYEFDKQADRKFAVTGYLAENAYVVDLNPNRPKPVEGKTPALQSGEVNAQVVEIIDDLIKRNKKVWVIDISSSLTVEQNYVYRHWRADGNAELLIFVNSGLKTEQEGLNMNTYGTIHWAYKHPEEKDKFEGLKEYFDNQKKLPLAYARSRVGNEMRRYFKGQGGVNWKGIRDNKDVKNKEKEQPEKGITTSSFFPLFLAPLQYTITQKIDGDGNCLYNSLRGAGMTGLSVQELRRLAAHLAMEHYYASQTVKPVRDDGETELNYQTRLEQYQTNLRWERRTSNRVINTLLNDKEWFDEGDHAAEFVLQAASLSATGHILLVSRGQLFLYNNGLQPIDDTTNLGGAKVIVRGFNHYDVGIWGNDQMINNGS